MQTALDPVAKFGQKTEFDYQVEKKIRGLLSRNTAFSELMRNLRGVFPLDAARAIVSFDKSALKQLLDNERSTTPQIAGTEGSSAWLGNPILCSWHFTNATCEVLRERFPLHGQRLAFFGTPNLFVSYGLGSKPKQCTLFDADEFITQKIVELNRFGSNISVINADIWNYDFSEMSQAFDSVFMDPPWYVDDYLVWIEQASKLLAQNGTIYSTLFPELVRETAVQDRETILKAARQLGGMIRLEKDVFEYEVPTFEAAQLRAAGLPTNPWKLADLMVVSFPSKPRQNSNYRLQPSPRLAAWREIDFPNARIFVNTNPVQDKRKSFMEPASADGLVLESPSARLEARQQANVLTSSGHALITNDPKKLIGILERMLVANRKHDGNGHSIIEQDGIESQSAKLIEAIVA